MAHGLLRQTRFVQLNSCRNLIIPCIFPWVRTFLPLCISLLKETTADQVGTTSCRKLCNTSYLHCFWSFMIILSIKTFIKKVPRKLKENFVLMFGAFFLETELEAWKPSRRQLNFGTGSNVGQYGTNSGSVTTGHHLNG